jgi:hypothetical protein
MRTSNSKTATCFRMLLLGLSLVVACSCAVSEKQAAQTQGEACLHHANAFSPERLILNLTEHPSRSQAVTWRTCAKVSSPKAQIAAVAESPALKDNLRTIDAVSEEVRLGKTPRF